MRSVFMTVPVVAAAVLLTGAACSTGSTPTALEPSPTSPASGAAGTPGAPAATTEGSATAGNGDGSGTGAATADCRTADVEAVVAARPDRTSGNTRMAIVTLTNRTRRACVVDGWASISLSNAANEAVRVPTTEVNEPSAPARATLKPGTTVWAGLKWTACDKGDDTCGAGNALRFNLPASAGGDAARLVGFPDPGSSDITMKSLQIGSLQPLRVDVVTW